MAKTLSAAQQALIDQRAYGVFYLFSLALPSGTIYRTSWDQNLSWNSQTWLATVCDVQQGPMRNNASAVAAVLLSANQLANQAIAFADGIKGAAVTTYRAFYDLSSLATGDVETTFTGVVRQVRTVGGWLVMDCQQQSAMKRIPVRKYDRNHWGKFISKPGSFVIGNRTIIIEQDDIFG